MNKKLHKLDLLNYLNEVLYTCLQRHSISVSSRNLVDFSNRLDLGQFQTNLAFLIMKTTGSNKNPIQIAKELIPIISQLDEIDSIIQVNGFINFSLSFQFLTEFLNNLLNKDVYLVNNIEQKKVLIDFGGPNIAKAMHVGHLRSSIIGDSLQKIYRFFGNEVFSDIHLGDWGLPIGMIIMKLEENYPHLKTEILTDKLLQFLSIDLLEEIYPIAAMQCKENLISRQIAQKITMALQQGDQRYKKIWQKITDVSIKSLKKNYSWLNINFDLWYGESHVNDLIPILLNELQEKQHVYTSEGAVIANTGHEAPLILVNSEGGITYGMTDIATIYDRVYNLKFKKIIYVVDKRQSLHFKQVFELAKKAFDLTNVILEHVEFGTLNGKDGRPFKTREGGVMKLEDLVLLAKNKVMEKIQSRTKDHNIERMASIIGVSALKFADLSKYRRTDYIFDIDQFVEFNGKTGPYLIYSCVRIKSILNKAAELEYNIGSMDYLLNTQNVKDVLNILIKFYYFLQKSYFENSPHYLGEYLYNLAQAFSTFYSSINILNHSDLQERASLLGLCKIVLINVEKGLELLGIEAGEVTYM